MDKNITPDIEKILEASEQILKSSNLFNDNTDILTKIKARREKLHQTSTNLKAYFVGLDDIIDRVITSIEAWYVLPEIVTHPTIICLWGLTGTGKTDLVRRLVSELGFNDKFLEIQFSSGGKSNYSEYDYGDSIKSKLDSSGIGDETGICLFDEIQRFKTIDQQGDDLATLKYNDLWELLSDGRFGVELGSKNNLIEYFLKDLYSMDVNDDPEADDDGNSSKVIVPGGEPLSKNPRRKRYTYSCYAAQSLKSTLRLAEPIVEIMKWTPDKRREVLMEKLNDTNFNIGTVFNKLLIILSGNLDEAYSMAKETSNADVDADTLHEFSKTIDIVSIKNSLKKRFKPEQIARFGNNHIIYPSLSKKTYEIIIERKIKKIIENVQEKSNVVVKFTPKVYQAVYDNGVYPAQGTRPVFSTISNMIEAAVPVFVLEAIENGLINVEVDFNDSCLTSTYPNNRVITRKVDCPLDNIKDNISVDSVALTSVHEAGHAIVYAVLMGLAPSELKSKVSAHGCDGYMMCHNIEGSRQSILDSVAITLAGGLAEEVVFGKNKRTDGWSSDIAKATATASSYVRTIGLGSRPYRISTSYGDDAEVSVLLEGETNDEVSSILSESSKKAQKILKNYEKLFKSISFELSKTGTLEEQDFVQICEKHDLKVKIHPKGEKVINGYKEMFDSFIKDCK